MFSLLDSKISLSYANYINIKRNKMDAIHYTLLDETFDENTIQRKENGDAWFAYFTDEIGGFKIHLIEN